MGDSTRVLYPIQSCWTFPHLLLCLAFYYQGANTPAHRGLLYLNVKDSFQSLGEYGITFRFILEYWANVILPNVWWISNYSWAACVNAQLYIS